MVDYEWMEWAWAQAWQLTALIVVVTIAVRCFARKRPHLAYVLWLVVLAKCLTPPVISSPAGIFCRLQAFVGGMDREEWPEVEIPRDNFPSADWRTIAAAVTHEGARADEQGLVQSIAGSGVEVDAATIGGAAARNAGFERVDDPFYSWEPIRRTARSFTWLGVVWVAGTLLFVLGMTWRTVACLRRLRQQGGESRPDLQELLVDLRRRLRIRQRVRLLVTRSSIGPAVIGLSRPTIVLPSVVATGRSLRELEAILAHELIHIRRGDLWTGLIQVLAQGVWWFHPLVWFANRRAILTAEACCDQETITELRCDPAAYAESLLDILAIRNKLVPVPAFPGVRPVDVTRERLERIMQIGQGCPRRTPWWCWMAMVLVAAGTLPGAAIVAGASGEDAPSAESQILDDAGTTEVKSIPIEEKSTKPSAIVRKASSEDIKATGEAIDSHIMRSLGSTYAPRPGHPNVLIKFLVHTDEKVELANRALLISADHSDSIEPIDSSVQLRGDVRLCLGAYVATAGAAEITRKSGALMPGQLGKKAEITINLFGGVRWASPGYRIHTDQLGATLQTDPEKPESGIVLQHLSATGRLPQALGDQKGAAQGIPGTRIEIFPGAFSDRPFSKPDGRVLNLGAMALYLRRGSPQADADDGSQEIRLVGNVKLQLANLRFQAREANLAFSSMVKNVEDEREALMPVSIALDREVEIEAIKFGARRTQENGTFHAEAGRAALTPILVQTKDRITTRCLGLSLSENVRLLSQESALQADRLQMELAPIDIGTEGRELPRPYPLPRHIELSGNVRVRSRSGESEEQIAQADRIVFDLRKKSMTISPVPAPGEAHDATDDKEANDSTRAVSSESQMDKPAPAAGTDRGNGRADRPIEFRRVKPIRNESIVSRALDRRISLHFKDQSLRDVAKLLMNELQVNIAIRAEALEEAGISLNAAVSTDIDDVPAREALRQIFEPLKLTATDGGEVLYITSRVAFIRQTELVTVTYPVADLVVPVQNLRISVTAEGSNEVAIRKSKQTPEFSQLIELIESTIKPDTWDNVGGPGSVREFHTTLSLVVRQTSEVHDELAELLGKLRALRDLQVTLEMTALRVPADLKPELEFPIQKDDVRGALVDADKVAALREAVEGNSDAKLYPLPRMNLMHGQGLEINIQHFGRYSPPFQLVSAIAPHRECVALSFAFGAKDPLEAISRASSFVIQADNSLLVDVTDELKTNPVAGLRPGEIAAIRRSMKKDSGERCLLLITPRFPPTEKEAQATP